MYIIYIYIYTHIYIYIYEYVYVYSTVVSFAPISNPQLSLTIIITTIIIITIITRHTFLVSIVLGIGMQSQAHPAIIRGSRIRGHGCLSRPSESACLAENEAWTNETCEGSTGKYWYVGFLEKWGKKNKRSYLPLCSISTSLTFDFEDWKRQELILLYTFVLPNQHPGHFLCVNHSGFQRVFLAFSQAQVWELAENESDMENKMQNIAV